MNPAASRKYYLRVSLTEACAFRCPYCLPDGPSRITPRPELLTPAEIGRAVRVLSSLGVDRVRLTGGEPLQRRECLEVVEQLSQVKEIRDIALTTNGEHLARLAGKLKKAGLKRVNVHLDSLKPERFLALARNASLEEVLEGIAAAREAELGPIKINAVIMRGVNDDEILDFCEFALRWGVTVRFIELMNTGSAQDFFKRHFMPAAEIRDRVSGRYRLEEPDGPRGSRPAEEFPISGGKAAVGSIASESEPFCAACDRLRLTADGRFARCLYEPGGVSIRALLRDPAASDDQLQEVFATGIAGKRSWHPTFGRTGERPFAMAEIGG